MALTRAAVPLILLGPATTSSTSDTPAVMSAFWYISTVQ